MSKVSAILADSRFLNKKQLINLKTKAIRSGLWFKILQRIDRVLFDLTIKVVSKIRSAQLAKSILTLTRKLENAAKSTFLNRLHEIGLPLAQKISSIAQKIGNSSASEWALDISFINYLAVIQINNSQTLRC